VPDLPRHSRSILPARARATRGATIATFGVSALSGVHPSHGSKLSPARVEQATGKSGIPAVVWPEEISSHTTTWQPDRDRLFVPDRGVLYLPDLCVVPDGTTLVAA
jgi:hypothetical protein